VLDHHHIVSVIFFLYLGRITVLTALVNFSVVIMHLVGPTGCHFSTVLPPLGLVVLGVFLINTVTGCSLNSYPLLSVWDEQCNFEIRRLLLNLLNGYMLSLFVI